jgi:hypothetical protein
VKAARIAVLFVLLALPAAGANGQGSLLNTAKGLLGATGSGETGSSQLSVGEIASGLREALKVGTERVVGQLGRADGFNADPEVHIPLPDTLRKVQSALRAVGMSELADDLELRLNRAAEAATPEAKEVFWDAIAGMTIDDARQIYDGPPDAATRYFEAKTSTPLGERMRPIIDGALAEVGAIAAYDRMMGQYKTIPFVPDVKADLTDYALEEALEGLFHYLAVEEAAIRQNPAKRTTDLLKRVFGAG